MSFNPYCECGNDIQKVGGVCFECLEDHPPELTTLSEENRDLRARVAELKGDLDEYNASCIELSRQLADANGELAHKNRIIEVLAEELVAWRQPSWRRRCLLWTAEKIIAQATAKAKETK